MWPFQWLKFNTLQVKTILLREIEIERNPLNSKHALDRCQCQGKKLKMIYDVLKSYGIYGVFGWYIQICRV